MKFSFKTGLSCLFLLIAFNGFAQTADLRGTVADSAKGTAIKGAVITHSASLETAETDSAGHFILKDLAEGTYAITIRALGYEPYSISVNLVRGDNNIGTLLLNEIRVANTIQDEIIPIITLNDDDNGNSSSSDNVSGILTASRDAFVNAAAFNLGIYRFRIRGYNPEYMTVSMNFIPMNDLENGNVSWNQWGGLNDMMRNRSNTIGIAGANYGNGGVGGIANIDSRAGTQYKQFRASVSSSNRVYNNRVMVSYSTGELKNGWSFSFEASKRWSLEGYVPGTFYDGYSYFASAEKRIGSRQRLAFTVFGTPLKRGNASPSTKEMNDLAGSNFYNPNWGYQNGTIRNSRVLNTHLPTFFINHQYETGKKAIITTSASYQFGRNGNTALDWNNAPDPRPDYYKNLPSYAGTPELAGQIADLLRNNESMRQLNWDNMYRVNAQSLETINNVNGTNDTVTVNLARYIVQEYRSDPKRFHLGIIADKKVSGKFQYVAGANYNFQCTHNYQLVKDLLGADYYIDLNKFAQQDYPGDYNASQNDLNKPNRLLKEGDTYGYNYKITNHVASAWAQGTYTVGRFDLYGNASLSATQFWRTGLTRYGLFPNSSEGNSEKQQFVNPALKLGTTYKLNGRNYFYVYGAQGSKAPLSINSFVSARTRNDVVKDLKSETFLSGEIGYLFKAPKVKIRTVLYATQFTSQVWNRSFYYDNLNTFVNYTLSGINTRHTGAEFSVEAEVYPGLKIVPVVAVGQQVYTSRPKATITEDNSSSVVAENQDVYIKGFYLDNGPQTAGTLGIHYRSPKYWFVNINFSYFDRIYTDINPSRRTLEVLDQVNRQSQKWDSIISQERLKGQFVTDVSVGFSWKLNNSFSKLKRSQFLNFNLGVYNLFNNTDFITGGFEQLRFDNENKNVSLFPSKYFYSFGRNYFANITYRF